MGGRSAWISLDLPDGTIPVEPGGVTDHHVTVAYLGSDVDDDQFAQATARARAAAVNIPGPAVATIQGMAVFEPSEGSGGKAVVYAPIASPGIDALRETLADLDGSGRGEFTPHVTLAYVDAGGPLPQSPTKTEVAFTHLSVHRKGAPTIEIPFGGSRLWPTALAA
jgi:2'-5' RNA ligase